VQGGDKRSKDDEPGNPPSMSGGPVRAKEKANPQGTVEEISRKLEPRGDGAEDPGVKRR